MQSRSGMAAAMASLISARLNPMDALFARLGGGRQEERLQNTEHRQQITDNRAQTEDDEESRGQRHHSNPRAAVHSFTALVCVLGFVVWVLWSVLCVLSVRLPAGGAAAQR